MPTSPRKSRHGRWPIITSTFRCFRRMGASAKACCAPVSRWYSASRQKRRRWARRHSPWATTVMNRRTISFIGIGQAADFRQGLRQAAPPASRHFWRGTRMMPDGFHGIPRQQMELYSPDAARTSTLSSAVIYMAPRLRYDWRRFFIQWKLFGTLYYSIAAYFFTIKIASGSLMHQMKYFAMSKSFAFTAKSTAAEIKALDTIFAMLNECRRVGTDDDYGQYTARPGAKNPLARRYMGFMRECAIIRPLWPIDNSWHYF